MYCRITFRIVNVLQRLIRYCTQHILPLMFYNVLLSASYVLQRFVLHTVLHRFRNVLLYYWCSILWCSIALTTTNVLQRQVLMFYCFKYYKGFNAVILIFYSVKYTTDIKKRKKRWYRPFMFTLSSYISVHTVKIIEQES